ncbi:MAG: endoribonuclease MazF [Spirochaetes bacterium]|nr:MAG: endoribonuclease MazF [Spirochaetota bacterium]RKX89008.1 MAG: endoribonuclease MazF [Spirochaetota bacterium]
MKPSYVPERGDLVWLDFNPQAGHEQSGKRSAIILSPSEYNARIGLCVVCPITSKEKGYPFEVQINEKRISGVVLSDHIKSLDWKIREIRFIDKASKSVLELIAENILLLIGID